MGVVRTLPLPAAAAIIVCSPEFWVFRMVDVITGGGESDLGSVDVGARAEAICKFWGKFCQFFLVLTFCLQYKDLLFTDKVFYIMPPSTDMKTGSGKFLLLRKQKQLTFQNTNFQGDLIPLRVINEQIKVKG